MQAINFQLHIPMSSRHYIQLHARRNRPVSYIHVLIVAHKFVARSSLGIKLYGINYRQIETRIESERQEKR